MKVALACDYAGYPLKKQVQAYLISKGYDVLDLGQSKDDEKVPYTVAVPKFAKALQNGEADKGIVFCGTGTGVSILANKFKGVYCVACESAFTAKMIAQFNGANAMSMGAKVVGPNNAFMMADLFLEGDFCKDLEPEMAEWITPLRKIMLQIEDENLK